VTIDIIMPLKNGEIDEDEEVSLYKIVFSINRGSTSKSPKKRTTARKWLGQTEENVNIVEEDTEAELQVAQEGLDEINFENPLLTNK
jgi:hypothetical protein